jgi:hypothetical protein
MSVKVIGSDAKVHWLSNLHDLGNLTKDHGLIYVTKDGKLGQATAESYAGLTPGAAFERRYNGMKSAMSKNFIADDLFAFDKIAAPTPDTDDGIRALIVDLAAKKRIPFTANVGLVQYDCEDGTNSEALIRFDHDAHIDILINVIKQYLGLEMFFDTKDPIIWRFKQEDDIEEIHLKLLQHRLCLFAAYTSRGKTKIGIEVAVRLCQQGGIILVTTPITDTKQSFKDNINDFHFGADRNLKVTYMDSVEFAKTTVTDLRIRADNGELIFVVLTVQDLRYGDAFIDATTAKLRKKYDALSDKVDLWIRDERHSQYGGEVTSQRLGNMTAKYELDLTATPYNVLDKYHWDQIVSRTLLWGLQYKKDTKLPTIRIDAISTLLSNVSPKIAALYTEEEGFDPRKLFVRSNGKFLLRAELLDICEKMYHSKMTKTKNPLSIVNDRDLSDVAINCGLWVLPEGQDGDGAADYIPHLATLLNTNNKTFFTDSYTLEKNCPKDMSIGKYVESLIKDHGRVIILTCGKFLTGTDIPALGHIVLMAKMSNIANFEQLMGRMIREYPGKDEVKMYCFAPAMDIGLVQGKMAKMNVALNGGSEYEMLECIPLTEYVNGKPIAVSPTAILSAVQDFFKSLSKDKLPQASLDTQIASIDAALLAKCMKLDTTKFKKATPKSNVTDSNGAKVKTKIGTNPVTGKPYTKTEANKLEQIANLMQTVMVEAKWIAYSFDNYDYMAVLTNPILTKMFPAEINVVIEIIKSDSILVDMVTKNLNEKQLAYKGLEPVDVYDDIFVNNKFKRDISLVYVDFKTATDFVANFVENKYNKEGIVILVTNALNGTIPLMLRARFPKARIECLEYFDYFVGHLTRLGFPVTIAKFTENETLYMDATMKFDAIVGNPPYNDSSNGNIPIYQNFVEFAKNNSKSVGMIIPAASAVSDERYGDAVRKSYFTENTKIIKFLPKDTFNADVSTLYFVQDTNYSGKTLIESEFGHYEVNAKTNSYIFKDKILFGILAKCQVTSASNGWIKFDRREKDAENNKNKVQTVTLINKTEFEVTLTRAIDPSIHQHKVVTSFLSNSANHLDVMWYVAPGIAVKKGYTVSIVKSESEGKNLAAYLKSKLCRFIYDATKTSRSLRTPQLKFIPKVALTKKWSDKALYKHFGLTQKEINYIEESIK